MTKPSPAGQPESPLLLTGGTGFFGRALLRHWSRRAQSHQQVPQVTVLSRSPDAFGIAHPDLAHAPWLKLVRGDILAPESLPKGHRFSHILHAAADSTRGPQLSPLQRFDQILSGTRYLLDFARECGATRFLYISSGAIYGPQPSDIERLPEDWPGASNPLSPNDTYGNAKRAAEALCELYHQSYGLEVVIARCFAFIGPDLPLDVHFAIGNFIRDALWGDEIRVNGDGTAIRSYLDQDDLAQWLLTLLDEGQPGRAYNVGSDQAIRIADLATLVRDLLAPDKKVRILKKSGTANTRNLYVPSIQRVRQELDLSLTISLPDAIGITAQIALTRGAP
ncbi:MAG: hypothetical protein RIR70_339 [Pseudomonadota bacterium]|jgi:dTDP-glucose 4,6-dehydratase